MDARSSGRQAAEPSADIKRWGVGCAVGGAATIGVVILVFLVALALQPPAWVQILLGVVLAIGAAIFTWLVAKAWQPSERSEPTGRSQAKD